MSNLKKRILCISSVVFVIVLVGAIFVGGQVYAKILQTKEEETEHAVDDIYLAYRCGSGSSTATECGVVVAGSTIEEKIWSGLISIMTDEQAAGVMGNMAHEGGFNPARHETKFINSMPNYPIATSSSESYGIGLIQWSFGRRTKLYQFMKDNGGEDLWNKYIDEGRETYGRLGGADFLAKAGDADTDKLLALELCYLKQELEGNDTYAGVLETSTVAEAASYFLEHVEVPADIPGQRPIRVGDAEKYYAQFHGQTITGSSSSGSGGSNPSCNPNLKGSLNINGAAVALAWPYGTDSSKWKWGSGTGTDLFNQVYEELIPKKSRSSFQGCDGPIYGASCDRFVSTVVRFAGNDLKFATGVGGWEYEKGMLVYASKHPDLWEVIEWDGDESKLKAGDVVLRSSHVAIAVQDKDGKFWIAEAGLCSSYGHIAKLHTNFDYILRSKNANNSTNGVSVTEGVMSASMTGTVTSGPGQGNGDINGSAIELAWPEGSSEASKSATPRFQEVFNSLKGGPGSSCWAYGKSCSVFVNTVLLYAGAQTGQKVRCPGCIGDDLIASDDWEEINYGNAEEMKYSELQPGDVIVYYWKAANPGNESKEYYKGLHAAHIAIYVKNDDGDKIAEASFCNFYGRITDGAKGNVKRGYSGARVFRWKYQNGGSGCNTCNNDSDGIGLKAGGMTLEEAKEWIKEYHDAAMGKYYKHRGDIKFQGAQIHDAECPFGVMNNCVALSQWFVNKYTSIGPNWNETTNGVGLVDKLVSSQGLEHGTEPRPYAIFSNGEWSSAGHTGVIMGVDTDREMVVVAEASCSESSSSLYYEPNVSEYSFKRIKGWEYAYTDKILNTGGI